MEQYSERRRREMHEDAIAQGLAYHDPKGLDALRGEGDDYELDPDSEYETDWRTNGE